MKNQLQQILQSRYTREKEVAAELQKIFHEPVDPKEMLLTSLNLQKTLCSEGGSKEVIAHFQELIKMAEDLP